LLLHPEKFKHSPDTFPGILPSFFQIGVMSNVWDSYSLAYRPSPPSILNAYNSCSYSTIKSMAAIHRTKSALKATI